jgi:hypothetical protein
MLGSIDWLRTDILGLVISSIKGPIGNPKTSVLNQPVLRNISEGRRIQVNCSESVHSRRAYFDAETCNEK